MSRATVIFTSSIHPSIFYTRLISRSGRGGAGAYPSGHRVRGRVILQVNYYKCCNT